MTAETADIVLAAARGMDVLGLAVHGTERERQVFVPKKKRREEEEEEEEEEVQMEMEENFTHMCKICKKKFVSGRAFGGHMRIHGPVATAHAAAEQGERLGASNELQKKRCRAPHVRAKDEERSAKSIEAEQHQQGGEGGFDANDGSAMYALRRHPKRSWRISDRDFSLLMDGDDRMHPSKGRSSPPPLGNSHGCEACGKDFSSWKSLIAHMKCHSDPLWKTRREDGDDADENWEDFQKSDSPQGGEEEDATDGESDNEIEQQPSGACRAANSSSFERWMKGKRSKRARYALQAAPHAAQDYQSCSDNNEDEEVAMCLVMLSGGVDTRKDEKPKSRGTEDRVLSGSKAISVPRAEGNASELQKCVTKKPKAKRQPGTAVEPSDDLESGKAVYECATCNKVFHSHQALGGHRASHKKVKGCSSRMDWHEGNESLEEEITDEELIIGSDHRFQRPAPKDASSEESYGITAPAIAPNGKTRVHECSICHRIFPTGQALGGHKRCHWNTTGGASETTSTVSSTKDVPLQHYHQQQRSGRGELLDLNLPASAEGNHCMHMEDATRLTALGVTTMDSHRPSSDDVESHSKFGPPSLPPWWMGGYPRRGLFLCNGHRQLSLDDEVDSRPGAKIGFDRARKSDLQARPQPWLVL